MPDSWIGLSRTRLRWSLGSFLLALAIPTGVLLRQTYTELQWESFHQYRVLAEELAARIDSRLRQLIASEEARPRSDYGFLVPGANPAANVIVRSPLSGYPVRSAIPGLIGYFQIDDRGLLTTPLLPPTRTDPTPYGIPPAELKARRELQSRIRDILARGQTLAELDRRPPLPFNPLLHPGLPSLSLPNTDTSEPWLIRMNRPDRVRWADPAEAPGAPEPRTTASSPSPQDRNPQRVPQVDRRTGADDPQRPGEASHEPVYPPPPPFLPRSELSRIRYGFPDTHPWQTGPAAPLPIPPRVTATTAVDSPFAFDRITTGHFVLSRSIWRDGHRVVQGALIEPDRFLAVLIERDFRQTAVSRMSELEVTYRDIPLLQARGSRSARSLADSAHWRGDVLYRTRLSPPLSEIELLFTIDALPAGPGAAVVGWLGAILAAVLIGGCWLLYRLGLRQIAAAQQQQNFVAAVSHELKTPLTSIRMYGEMLREGWVPEERRASCYEFICTESERLSRLITNVLQLARLTRSGLAVELKPMTAAQLLEGVRPRLAAQVDQAGFALTVDYDGAAGDTLIQVDEDCFAQIAINLVDNALKFAAGAANKRVELCCYRHGPQALVISVRDFGPGIPKDRIKKIFRLFYRGENERVRETVGTGIGLALVQQLAAALRAPVDVINHEPGAEFRIWFTPCDHPSNGASSTRPQ